MRISVFLLLKLNMPSKRKRSVASKKSSQSNKWNKTEAARPDETGQGRKGNEEGKTAQQPTHLSSPLDPTTEEVVPRLIVLGGQQSVVSASGSVEMGRRTWTVQQADPLKLVLTSVTIEDEDVKFSAAKDALKQEVSQRRQDIQHLEEDKMGVLSRMEDENEDADALATELGTTPLCLLFMCHKNLTNNPHKPPSPL